jgi:bla regulator protein BlaR1
MTSALFNHIWQSTLFAAPVWLLTLLLRRNAARTRYWLWLAASVKFLVPFSLLVTAGSYLDTRSAGAVDVSAPFTIEPSFVMPLAPASASIVQHAPNRLPEFLFAGWAIGFLAVLIAWCRQWLRSRSSVRDAREMNLEASVRVMTSGTSFEPGIFGVIRPVLLLPEGITQRLSPQELKSILTHELCHVRYRDNLTAAIHMLVEALFWFHPLVWWMGARLIDERERACDEEVLRQGSDPQLYAESILKVCTLYLESPLPCVAGVTGSNLRQRIGGIMSNRIVERLDAPKKFVIAAATAVALAGPILFGIANAPQIRAQSAASAGKKFDVASIKAANPKTRPDVRVSPTGIDYFAYSLRSLIAEAYSFRLASITSPDNHAKDLLNGEFFDISAKTDHPVSQSELHQMLQTLLADRFKLTLHHELRSESVYRLATAAGGMKLRESAIEGPLESRIRPDGGVNCKNTTMQIFSEFLTARLSRVVLDDTGLNGRYDFELKLDGLPSVTQLQEAASSGNMEAAGAMKRKMVDWTESSIFSDIQKQLGLRLESGRASVDNLVVDRVEKPTEN